MPKFQTNSSFLSLVMQAERSTFSINFVLAILPDTHQSHPHDMKRMEKMTTTSLFSGWNYVHVSNLKPTALKL